MNTLEAWTQATRKHSPRPTTWDDIIGNARAKEILREAITAAKKDKQPLPHTLLFGPPGMGKSTISKVVAAEMGSAFVVPGRRAQYAFVETTASTLETPQDVLQLVWRLNAARETTGQPACVFIDEIHMLGAAKGRQSIDQESLFTWLEDWEFFHNLVGKKVEDLSDGLTYIVNENMTRAWPFCAIGATTEAGLLNPALLRRFLIKIELEPYSQDELAQILLGASRRIEWPMSEPAAAYLAKFSRRNPGMANELLTHARQRASARDMTEITADVAIEVIQRLNLYPLGLTDTDIRVLLVLYDRAPKGVGMAEIARAVGISQSQFTGMIEPYLRLLGFLEIQSRRVIRPEGIRYLQMIGKIQ